MTIDLAAAAKSDEAIDGAFDFLQFAHLDREDCGFLIAGESKEIPAAGFEQPLELDVGLHAHIVSRSASSFHKSGRNCVKSG